MKFQELKIILKRLYKTYISSHIKKILIALILSIIVAGTTAAIAWLLDPAVKKIFIEKDRTLAWFIPILIVITFTSKGLSLYFARVIIIRIGEEIAGKIKKEVANNILVADVQTIENRHSGKYISNIMHDTGLIQNLVSSGVFNLMKDSFSIISLVALMFYQNWKLALFAILMMPLAAGLARTLGKRIGKATGEASISSGKLVTFLTEILKASKMIKIYQKESDENKKADTVINDLVEKQIKIGSILVRATPIMETLTGLMIAGFIFFSGKLIASGQLEVNQFFSFLAAMMLAYQPIRSLATINMTAFSGAEAFKRISTVIDKKVEVVENKSLPDLIIKNSDITFKDITFKYETTNAQAIKDINFNIKGNTMAAFVGHSGAGKSTIINLLPRFYSPQLGSIFIDGQNIKEISLKSLRKNLSMVSQDVVLFDETVKKNISYAKSDASFEEIKRACKFAAADKFIEELPNGYDTLIGENGVRLSGGQKQRLSIARAILKKSPIILLDEATSSLDAESEVVLQNAILNLTKNKTTLVIAHRLSTIHNAQIIFVLKNGKIINSGSHEFLIQQCSEYKSLYNKQLK